MKEYQQRALTAIDAERRRQIEGEGFSAERDDAYAGHELDRAASSYYRRTWYGETEPKAWPWPIEWWKPRSAERDLIRAGALWRAEHDRLERLPAKTRDRAGDMMSARMNIADAVRALALIYRDRNESATTAVDRRVAVAQQLERALPFLFELRDCPDPALWPAAAMRQALGTLLLRLPPHPIDEESAPAQ